MPHVSRSPRHSGIWFALTLLVPATFAAAWLWLVPGGVVARAADDERRVADELLATAERTLLQSLQHAADAAPVVLRLDAERRVVAPFPPFSPFPTTESAAPIGLAEQAAHVRLDAGAIDEAVPFFAHAAAEQALTPLGSLRYAAARAARDPAAARELLSDARARHAGVRLGLLPFDVVALLAAARLPGGPDAGCIDALAPALLDVPADLMPTVLEDLAAACPETAHDERFLHVAAAAAAAALHRSTPAPNGPTPTIGGCVVLPRGDDACVALPTTAFARARAEALAAAAALHPTFVLTPTAAGDAPARPFMALGETWAAEPTTTPTSTLLAIAARASLLLALATLIAGNLLLWRLTRRESQLVRLRADFVDIVSHELRTPLTALSLKAEMLAADDVPAERRRHYLEALDRDVQRLADQVERILDFGRLQRGAPLRRDPVPARTLLARGLRQGRAALRLVEQRVEVEAARALPPIVGDVDVLGRALRNLLENAAKYAPPGSKVAVRAFAQGDELVGEVADRGPGVPPGERRSVFEPFVRGTNARPGTPGSGLGLALVAAAAASHRGRVTVGERPGGGSVFTLQLPLHSMARGETAPERRRDGGAAG
jgi:signal transduction histidine kinase